eukprot:197248_1
MQLAYIVRSVHHVVHLIFISYPRDAQYIIMQPRLRHVKKANINPTMHLRFAIMPPTANKPKNTPLSNVHLLTFQYSQHRRHPMVSLQIPFAFSTTTASTPSPPPLSTSFHHNILNDIIISMDKDTNISSSIKTKDEAIECP